MSCSRPEGAAPSDGGALRANAPPNGSDGREWPDLLDLLLNWSDDDLGDALWLDGIMDEGDSVDSDALPGDQLKDECVRRWGRTKKPSTRAQRAVEIRRLQKECNDLYKTLVALREAVKAAGSSQHDTTAGSLSRCVGVGKRSQSTSSSWVAQAGKQREMLVLVERANRELKREMRVQKREARSLHRVLTKRVVDAQILWNQLYSSVDAMPLPSSLSTPIFSDTCLVFAKLLQETEAMRPKVDMMLQYFRTKVTCPVASGSFRESKMTRCSNEEDTVLVEMVDVEELPFSIPNVCNAVENMYRTYEMEHFAKQNFNTSDETIMATSFFTYDYGEGIMHARLRQVAQYFTTETYAAFVSTFIVELLTQTQGEEVPVDKVQEWRIVSATDDGTTLHQTFAVLLPKIAHSMATLSDSKQLFSQLVGAWLASFSCTNQQIENLLLSPPSSSSMRTLRRKRPDLHKNRARLDGEQPQNTR